MIHSQNTPLLSVSTKKSHHLNEKQQQSDGKIPNDSSASQTSFLRTKVTKFVFLLNFALLKIFDNVSLGLPSPFLARVVESKGGTIFEAAVILQARAFSMLIFSPVFGYFHPKIGVKKLLIVSLVAMGLSLSGFSLLPFINEVGWLTAVGILTRFAYGVARSGLIVAVTVLACSEFPEQVSFIYGFLQGFASAGYLIGHSIGGALYDRFGMFSPVLVSGIILILLALPQFFILQTNESNSRLEEGDSFQHKNLLLNPIALSTLLVLFSHFGNLAFVDTALTIYFEELDLSATATGIALGILGAASAVFAMLSGYLASRSSVFRKYCTSIAMLLFSAAMFLFSPNQTLVIIYLACFLLGALATAIFVPALETLAVIAVHGLSSKHSPKAIGDITGIFYFVNGIGTFTVPSVATLIQSLTSANFSTIFYGLAAFSIVLATIQACFTLFWNRGS